MRHPIVILHGWGLSKDRYDGLVRELRNQHFQVFAVDFPGFGKSETPNRPQTLSDYAAFLHAYLTDHAVKAPILLGHSFGGRVALKYQVMYPGKVHALILTGTPGFTPVPKKKLMLVIAMAKIGGFVFSLPIINFFQEYVRRWYYYAAGARDYYRAEGIMRMTFKNIVRENLLDYMRSVRVPTYLVWGAQDIITPVWIAQKMNKEILHSKLTVIPNSDHGVSFKNPVEFVAVILPWLETL